LVSLAGMYSKLLDEPGGLFASQPASLGGDNETA